MDTFKIIVETLNALASLVAICAVLIVWYQSRRKALKVSRVLVHNHKESTTHHIYIKNRKPYPVEINTIRCLAEHKYKVEHKVGFAPEFSSTLSLGNGSFISNENFNIEQNGYKSIKIETELIKNERSEFIFSMDTSHGYHLLKCSKTTFCNFGEVESYRASFIEAYDSKVKAICKYLELTAIHYFRMVKMKIKN